MLNGNRFGRWMPIPSTRQIVHELKMLQAADRIASIESDLRVMSSNEPTTPASISPLRPLGTVK